MLGLSTFSQDAAGRMNHRRKDTRIKNIPWNTSSPALTVRLTRSASFQGMPQCPVRSELILTQEMELKSFEEIFVFSGFPCSWGKMPVSALGKWET